jgi:hypothetical protein
VCLGVGHKVRVYLFQLRVCALDACWVLNIWSFSCSLRSCAETFKLRFHTRRRYLNRSACVGAVKNPFLVTSAPSSVHCIPPVVMLPGQLCFSAMAILPVDRQLRCTFSMFATRDACHRYGPKNFVQFRKHFGVARLIGNIGPRPPTPLVSETLATLRER